MPSQWLQARKKPHCYHWMKMSIKKYLSSSLYMYFYLYIIYIRTHTFRFTSISRSQFNANECAQSNKVIELKTPVLQAGTEIKHPFVLRWWVYVYVFANQSAARQKWRFNRSHQSTAPHISTKYMNYYIHRFSLCIILQGKWK